MSSTSNRVSVDISFQNNIILNFSDEGSNRSIICHYLLERAGKVKIDVTGRGLRGKLAPLGATHLILTDKSPTRPDHRSLIKDL